jgi:hypothetical protein
MPDLFMFISWPDHEQDFSKQLFRANTSLEEALENNIISSANMTLVKASPPLFIWTPLMVPTACSLSISRARISSYKMKRYGERGSPCLKPQDGRKCLDLPPLRLRQLMMW